VAALNGDRADPDSSAGTPSAGTSSAGKASETDLTATARDYFALLPREPADAWRKLSPKAQQQLGGLSAFNGYWSDISSLRLVSTSASVGDQTVRAQLKLQTTGGQSRTTTQRLVIVPAPDDGWLIDVVGGS
jgi:serine/threonine-protein kinase